MRRLLAAAAAAGFLLLALGLALTLTVHTAARMGGAAVGVSIGCLLGMTPLLVLQ